MVMIKDNNEYRFLTNRQGRKIFGPCSKQAAPMVRYGLSGIYSINRRLLTGALPTAKMLYLRSVGTVCL